MSFPGWAQEWKVDRRRTSLWRRLSPAQLFVGSFHDILSDQMIPILDPDSPLKDSNTLLVAGRDEGLATAAKVK